MKSVRGGFASNFILARVRTGTVVRENNIGATTVSRRTCVAANEYENDAKRSTVVRSYIVGRPILSRGPSREARR